MCEFCVKHGEGKKWYLNAKNYSDDLLSDVKRREYVEDFFQWVDKSYNKCIGLIRGLSFNLPIIRPALKAIVKRVFIYEHWGQVIPIEDVEKILSMTNSITRVPCVCRKTTKGKEIRTCFLISLDPNTIGIAKLVDQSFFEGPDLKKFETLNKIEALNFMNKQEKKGLCHTVWTLKAPFVGAICNCDNTGCIAIEMNNLKTPIFFRAEYIAQVDNNKCIGCKTCINICPFSAIQYDNAKKKVIINYRKCYGCGICRSVCKTNAIVLEDRNSLSSTVKLW